MKRNYESKTPTVEDLKLSWGNMFKSVFFLLGNKRTEYFICSITLIVVLFYDLVPAFIVGKLVNFFTAYTPGISLKPFYLYIIFLSVSLALVSQIRLTMKKKLSNIQSEVTYMTRVKGFERLLDFSLKWHDSENTGNKVQKIQHGTDSMKVLQKLLSNDIFPQLTTITGVMTAFFFLHISFFIFGLIYLVTFITIQVVFYKRILKLDTAHNTSLERATGSYYEGLSNVLTIKTLGVKDDFKKNISGREEMSKDFAIERTNLSNIKWKLFQIINAISIGTILLLAGRGFLAGAISLGSVFVVYTYFQKFNGTMADSTQVIDELTSAKVGITRMMPIFQDELYSHHGTKNFPEGWQNIVIRNGFFRYQIDGKEARDSGLTDLTIEIKKHEKIGVVGKSGSGKSTFAKMLLGLYDLEKGEYKIGDRNFYSIRHEDVTNKMALVLQDSEMFNLSLKDNITLMRKFDQKLFDQALQIAALSDLIEKLPEGVDAIIGEKGYRLSGGERQRIGIARAIYKDPEILILDEATSSLDSRTESAILKAFEDKLTRKTIISIAHRVSTLKNSDRIVVFDQGSIVEEGTFKELSKDSESKFFDIYQSQQASAKIAK